MAVAEVRAFRDEGGEVPLDTWLKDLAQREPRAHAKCLALIMALGEKGNELRRPTSDALRDGVRELRTRIGNVHYRLIYFFYGKQMACISHGTTKEGAVSAKDIELAVKRRKLVMQDPERYTGDFES